MKQLNKNNVKQLHIKQKQLTNNNLIINEKHLLEFHIKQSVPTSNI